MATPKCLDGSATVSFGKGGGKVVASVCGLTLKVPAFPLPPAFLFTTPLFPPPLPIPKLSFTLNCDLNNPIDVSAGLEFGGGRVSCSFPSADDEDE